MNICRKMKVFLDKWDIIIRYYKVLFPLRFSNYLRTNDYCFVLN